MTISHFPYLGSQDGLLSLMLVLICRDFATLLQEINDLLGVTLLRLPSIFQISLLSS